MLFLALALAALIVFKAVHARIRPTTVCRRCTGVGCPRCGFTGVRFRASAHLVHRRK